MKRKFGAVRNSFLKAYSLIELSIVLVIVSVLVSGAMVVSVDSLKTDQIRIAKERIDAVYKRLAYHIKTNRRLPCPALINKVRSADSDYGVAGTCASVSYGVYSSGNFIWGALPCATLGLPLDYCEDAFGNKFIYFVDKRFTVAADTGVAPVFDADINNYNFSTMANNQLSSSPATIWTIKENPAGSLQNITSNAVFGIVSAGANKFGAYNSNSSTANSIAGSDSDELNNHNTTSVAGYFVSSSPASNSFDDLVFYKAMKDIIADYPDLMYLVPCNNTNSQYINGSNTGNTWYDGIVYSKKAVCSSPNQDFRFSKKCGTNGNFIIQNESCAVTGNGTCSLTNNQGVGTGAQYTGATQTYPNGSIVPLSCKTNFGRKIIGGSRTSDNTAQTCNLTPTDRSTTDLPQAVCSNGVLYVINDCTSCRSCSGAANANGFTLSWSKYNACNKSGSTYHCTTSVSCSTSCAGTGTFPSGSQYSCTDSASCKAEGMMGSCNYSSSASCTVNCTDQVLKFTATSCSGAC